MRSARKCAVPSGVLAAFITLFPATPAAAQAASTAPVATQGASSPSARPAAALSASAPPQAVAPSSARSEVPIAGFSRRDTDTLALQLAAPAGASTAASAAQLLLHGFSFNGDPVPTSKLHLHQLAPGVLEITSLAYSVGDWEFSIADQANYYGTGEHFDALNRAHTVVRNASQDNAGAKGTSTYKPMPFFMSTTGYGLWVDTTAEATFDFNTTRLSDVIVQVPAEKLRLVLFSNPRFPAILDAFTKLTQPAVLPPYWAFAPWIGRDFDRSDADVREDLEKTCALGLPASVLLLDSPWETAYNSYKWNTRQFTDPAALVKQLHAAGFKLVVWHTPWIDTRSSPPSEPTMADKMDAHSPSYDEAAAHGYFVKRPDGTPWVGTWWKGQGSLIDFTNPAAKQWWQEQLRGAIAAGADGFKDDDGEGSFQGDAVFADRTPRELMRNRYAVLYNNAVEEVIAKDLKGNGALYIRSVTQGANGLGLLWAGDNESSFSPENGLPTVVQAALSAGMSGLPLWTADLGGYLNSPSAMDPVLLARWTEFAAFSPTMGILSQTNRQPWTWDTDGTTHLLDLYRRYAVLHMSLFPYRYAAAQEAAATGMPLMRALPLLYQDDPEARVASHEYLFGPDLLVAPIVDRNTRRPVYLPEGSWIDLWSGAALSGGRTVVVDAPLDTIPVFARTAAVLPKLPEDVMTLVPASESGNQQLRAMDDRRIFEVISADAAGKATFTDFEGRAVQRDGKTLTIGPAREKTAASPSRITVRWKFGKVSAVTVNGHAEHLESQAGASTLTVTQKGQPLTIAWQ